MIVLFKLHFEIILNLYLFFILHDLGQNEKEWQVEKDEIILKCPFVYVWNATEPLYSDYGRIGIEKGNMGGIIRTA